MKSKDKLSTIKIFESDKKKIKEIKSKKQGVNIPYIIQDAICALQEKNKNDKK